MTIVRCATMSVANCITKRISDLAAQGKTARQIADEVGYKNPNMISMLKTGRAKVPLERIPALARALDMDPGLLLRLAVSEYWPDLHRTIVEIFGAITTANERNIIQTFREVSKSSDAPITEQQKHQLSELFENGIAAIESRSSSGR